MTSQSIHIHPRYHRWHVDPGVEWAEKNTGYAHLDWEIPISEAALVLVDVWAHHYLQETEARTEEIVQQRIRPLLKACRGTDLRLIHAPAPGLAMKHPAWVRLVDGEERAVHSEDVWPPNEFRAKSGGYAQYARPEEPREKELAVLRARRSFHPAVEPEGEEVVIATGEELHRYCREQGILFLFYLGFNTNACILLRDYGTLEMSKRGYEVIVVRDCTTGMESAETHDGLWQTRGAVLFLEMSGKYSVSSDELIGGLAG